MGKHYIPRRLSSSELKSIDHKARRRIEELYILTDEIINGHHDVNNKYDHKLYKKYKQLKEINKKLQEKLINQHCSGCKCHNQLNDEENDQHTDNSPISAPLKSSTIIKTNQKNLLTVSDTEDTENDNRTNNETVLEISSDEEESMTTDEYVPKVTKHNNQIEEQVNKKGGTSRLPVALQAIIRNKVRKTKNDQAYLMEIGSHHALCKFLTNRSYETFDRLPKEILVRTFVSKRVEHQATDLSETVQRISEELREIHQSYVLKFIENAEETKVLKTRKQQQRVSI